MSKRITITGAFLIIFLMGMTQSLFSKFTDRTSDSLAIVALYDSTNGDSWTTNTNWKTAEPLDDWYKVIMIDGRVGQLNLGGNNLVGVIPDEIGNLTGLTLLGLHANSLSGPIPNSIGNLSNLENLYLSHNTLTGTIPDTIYSLTGLKLLSLMNNYSIQGTISNRLGELTNLETLMFESMSLEGPIPDELCSLTNLKTITMGNNQDISGTIPANIGNLVNLTKFSVYNNSLEGPIPESIGNLVNLEELVLANNSFAGEIPVVIGNLDKLTVLQIQKNNFTGAVPDTVRNLVNLTYFPLYTNDFYDLPDLSPLTSLNSLHIYNNRFTFEDIEPNIGVPASLFEYSPQDSTGTPMDISVPHGSGLAFNAKVGGANNLYQWYKDEILMVGENDTVLVFDPVVSSHEGIYFCEITNTIATELLLTSHLKKLTVLASPRKLDSLALVALYDSTNGASWTDHTNWLTAEPIDNWYGINITDGRVAQIDLSQNNLAGTIPDEIGNLSALGFLALNKNHTIYGEIPEAMGNLTNLEYLSVYQNQLSGSIPDTLGNLTNLYHISLYQNQFSGTIPEALGNLSKLSYLGLNENQLTGAIPDVLGDLSKLYYLLLNGNQLSGSIPDSLGKLSDLAILYLFDNQLTGTIPESFSNLSSLENLNIKKNRLTGSIPDALGDIPNLSNMDLSDNQFSGAFPTDIVSNASLKYLYISKNQLEVLPDLSALTSLDWLEIQNNQFTFEDIEPNIGLAATNFIYFPQDSVGEPMDTTIFEGDDLNLSIEVGGEHNEYQWKLDGADISGATSNSYMISAAIPADSGIYTCEVTNTVATELTLYSHPMEVTVDPATNVDNAEGLIPRSYALYQNYPNPFNPTTTIRYDLPKASEVTVKIYNVFGQKVKTIVNGMQTAGRKNVIWNGRDAGGQQVASGIYFYQISSASFNKTMKMVLLK